jgi:ribonuclease HI
MNIIKLFTDGSLNVQTKIGYGAILWISGAPLSLDILQARIKVKRFENTSSTKLELQTLMWALSEIPVGTQNVIVYTDSQNIVELLNRRTRLEQNNFRSKKNVPLKNGEMYKAFFHFVDTLNCEFIKIAGHQPSKKKNETERIFGLVDKASRKALRKNRIDKS